MDKEIVAFLKNFKFPQKPDKEKNIFDMGIRSMYENPFTEILSFIINQDSPYNNRSEFIKFFISELTDDENIGDSFCKELNVETQTVTKTGKIMDMVIYNEEYVIVLENKIEHIPNNPFEDYESEINSQFYSHKKKYFIFSLNVCGNIDKWVNKTIGNIFTVIKNKLQFKYDNKWDYFVKDFLDHYIEEKIQMTKKDFELCAENFSKFMYGQDFLYEFIDEIENQLKQNIQPKSIKRGNWDDGSLAIKIRPFEDEYREIVLLLTRENKFSISIYYTDPNKDIDELAEIVGNKYHSWSEANGKCKCFGLEEKYYFNQPKDAYKEIKIQFNKMKKIYS